MKYHFEYKKIDRCQACPVKRMDEDWETSYCGITGKDVYANAKPDWCPLTEVGQ